MLLLVSKMDPKICPLNRFLVLGARGNSRYTKKEMTYSKGMTTIRRYNQILAK